MHTAETENPFDLDAKITLAPVGKHSGVGYSLYECHTTSATYCGGC